VPDGDQFGESFVGGVVAESPAAGVLVEKLREALGAPPVQEIEVHRGHLPSLVTVSSAASPTVATVPGTARGRTGTNG
jgi:hypothetical protein